MYLGDIEYRVWMRILNFSLQTNNPIRSKAASLCGPHYPW